MNDPLRKCPRCGSSSCEHLELIVGRELAGIGTGMLNLNLLLNYTWVASLGRRGEVAGRTAIIELKRASEEVSPGLKSTYRDITGTLSTGDGSTFEQRGFIVKHDDRAGRWDLSTYRGAYMAGEPGLSLAEIRDRINVWIQAGELPARLEVAR